MRLEQLNYLLEITRLRSISRAAETLHISQPALSAAVKSLETELGRTLFKRTNRGISLTADGQKIHDEAEAVLEVIGSWYSRPSAIEAEGKIHLACTPIISCYLTPNIIVPFQKLHPGITIFVHGAQSWDIMRLLKTTSANMALTTLSRRSTLIEQARSLNWEACHLFTDERRLFLSATHPLAAKADLTAEDLKQLNLAWYSDERDQISRGYAPYFASSFRLANKEDILELVIKNEAVFIQPCRLFRHDWRVLEKLVVERPLPLPQEDQLAQVFALHAPDLSTIERMFWDYLLASFSSQL